jgi:hypothetical protein
VKPALAVAVALLAVVSGIGSGFFAYDGPVDSDMARIFAAIVMGLTAILCAPLRRQIAPARVAGPIGWAIAWGILIAVVAALLPGRATVELPIILGVAGATLVFALERAHAALVPRLDESGATTVVLLIALPATAAPLWLGPLSVDPVVGSIAATIALAISPLGYLAGATDVDVLRSTWLYAHSELGSVRYAYPDPFACAALLVGAGIGFWHLTPRSIRDR